MKEHGASERTGPRSQRWPNIRIVLSTFLPKKQCLYRNKASGRRNQTQIDLASSSKRRTRLITLDLGQMLGRLAITVGIPLPSSRPRRGGNTWKGSLWKEEFTPRITCYVQSATKPWNSQMMPNTVYCQRYRILSFSPKDQVGGNYRLLQQRLLY